MNNKIKILAMYLPQYHEIPENSKFWGKGFTDWVSTKNAKPLFNGHVQPNEPLNDNYYDLSKKESIKWQIELAKKYGIYGFGIYHYWFSDEKVLLTRPAEIILENKDLDIPFFFAWDNANWRRTWSKYRGNAWAPLKDEQTDSDEKTSSILVKYELGEKENWTNHFNYLLPYFKDNRYIKENNEPIFIIFNYSKKIKEMVDCWNELAIKNGFNGIRIIYKKDYLNKIEKEDNNFCYEPLYSGWNNIVKRLYIRTKRILKINEQKPTVYSYDKIWNKILKNSKKRNHENEWISCFVSYDDTPRRGKQGKIVLGNTPEKFGLYLSKLVEICRRNNKKYILLTAWNEWGEGAVLEPTKNNEYNYLKELNIVVNKDENSSNL